MLAPAGLAFDGDRNGVAVILNQEDHRETVQASRIHGFPEFPFAGGAIAAGNQSHRIAIRRQEAIGLRAADCLQILRSVQEEDETMLKRTSPQCDGIWRPPGCRIVGRADRLQEHVEGRHAQGQAERAIAVVRKDPIVACAKSHPRCYFDGFVPGPADLKKDAILALERDLAVIQTPGRLHDAECLNELIGLQPLPFLNGIGMGRGHGGQYGFPLLSV